MLALLVWLVIGVIFFSFLFWVNNGYIPEPFQKYGTLVIGLAIVVFIIWLLLGFIHGGLAMPSMQSLH